MQRSEPGLSLSAVRVLLDTFEVNELLLLQKRLKDLVPRRGLEVQHSEPGLSLSAVRDLLDAFEVNELLLLQKRLKDLVRSRRGLEVLRSFRHFKVMREIICFKSV